MAATGISNELQGKLSMEYCTIHDIYGTTHGLAVYNHVGSTLTMRFCDVHHNRYATAGISSVVRNAGILL